MSKETAKKPKDSKSIGEIYKESLFHKNPVTRSVYREMFMNRLDSMERKYES